VRGRERNGRLQRAVSRSLGAGHGELSAGFSKGWLQAKANAHVAPMHSPGFNTRSACNDNLSCWCSLMQSRFCVSGQEQHYRNLGDPVPGLAQTLTPTLRC